MLAAFFFIVAFATLAMPDSANFVGEFYILLGVFKSKLAIACIAFTGVVLASVYVLRVFIRTLHNRVGDRVSSREIGGADALVVVPLVAVILAIAVYPQLPLQRSDGAAKGSVAPAHAAARPSTEQAALP